MYGLANSALHAEAKACLQAPRWCVSKGKDEVLILTDSVNLINNLSKPKAGDIAIQWTISEIIELASTYKTCVLIKVDRQQVSRAHEIANMCHLSCFSFSN